LIRKFCFANFRATQKLNLISKLGEIVSGRGLQITFRDRAGAASVLSSMLKGEIKARKEDHQGQILILGIPRGGIVVGDIVAQKLNADFDIVLPRKLRAPDNEENSIGAIMQDGSVYLDALKVRWLKVSPEYIEKEKAEQLREIVRRAALYRPDNQEYNIRDKIVILVDDGVASGATLIPAARWIRKQQPKQLIIAAPVASEQAAELLKKEADQLKFIITPSNLITINQFYRNFDPVTDPQVIDILKKWQ
jgi:putative phosphoribosyl transferase